MDVYKPRDIKLNEKQKLNIRRKKDQPKGAVMKPKETVKEPWSVNFRKKTSDFFSELERVTGFVNKQVAVVFLVLAAGFVVHASVDKFKENMPIERVGVKGDFKQLDKRDLERTLSPLVGSNYFDLDIQGIKSSLLEFAWVQSVEVRKVWPASVEVLVVENRAIATWGENMLVNEFGKVFEPETMQRELLSGLPDLFGQRNKSDLVLDTYVKLSNLSLRSELSIEKFELVAEKYWLVKLNQGPEVFLPYGREEKAMKIFLSAYELALGNAAKNIARVDMRYSNGFSVKFSDEFNTKTVNMELETQLTPFNEKTGNSHG